MSKRIFSFIIVVVFVVSCASLIAQEKKEETVSKKAVRLMKKADKALESKEYDKAVEMYQKVIEMEPAYAPPHLKVGLILKEQKKYGEAASSLEKALQLQSQYPEAVNAIVETLYLLAQDMMAKKDLDKANELYLKIVGFSDVNEPGKHIQTQVYYQLGVNYYTLKKPAESNKYFTKFIETPGVETDYNATFIVANYILGVNYFQLKHYEQSNEYLMKFLELHKDKESHKQWVPLAHFLIGSNGFELLKKEVDKKEKTDIEGISKLAKGDNIIVPHLSKAIELGLILEQIYLTLGNYYYYCRDVENAIKNYKLLIEKFPDSPDISSYSDFLEQLEKDKEKK